MRSLRDPAPSRLAYRIHRLMLRRGMRRLLRIGLPTLILLTSVAIWASDDARRQAVSDQVAELRRDVEERPEFMVRMMSVGRASPRVAAEIREAVPLDFPVSSFDLNLDEIKRKAEALDAVAEASVRVRAGGVLALDVVERSPAVVWRASSGLMLLDLDGHRVAPLATRADRPDLPLIAGEGAADSVEEALALFVAAEPIRARVRGLLRVGSRRWDVVLDREQRIMLPEADPVTALKRVVALDLAQDLLSRDISHVDFRNVRRPVLRRAATLEEAVFEQ